jgi:hypothetical protein
MATIQVKSHSRGGKRVKAHTRKAGGGGGTRTRNLKRLRRQSVIAGAATTAAAGALFGPKGFVLGGLAGGASALAGHHAGKAIGNRIRRRRRGL